MKLKGILSISFLFLSFASIFVSCKDDKDDQLEMPYIFRPVGLNVTIKKTSATISWYAVDSAKSYSLQLSQDSLLFENLIVNDTIQTSSYTIELPSDTRFSVRVKAIASSPEKDSKFSSEITFKTPDIFDGFKSFMYDREVAFISWLPGVNATKLIFKSTTNPDIEFALNEEEITTGKRICPNVPNGTYAVGLYFNGTLLGTNPITLEGDYFVNAGDNLVTILSGISKDSAIVVIRPGVFSLGSSAFSINRSIKIRGLFVDTVPVICMEGASATAKMFDIATTSKIGFVRFENIEFSGYLGGGTSGGKIGYFLNQSTGCDIDNFVFRNCIIRNLGNTPIRLQTVAPKIIDNLSFEKCTIFDIGYSSVYAIVNTNVAGCSINNISFTKSTVYNFAGSIILHNTVSSNSVLLENCTFNQITTSGAGTTVRYIIDFNTNTVAEGITIKNCIFGSTPRAYTEGVRASAGTNKNITGSYGTADYYDNNALSGYSIIGNLTSYSGASSDLFVNPLTGDFHIKDAAFVGLNNSGDPRWYSAQ